MYGRRTARGGVDKKQASRERGAALVEAAMVIPILVLLILGVVDFGLMVNRGTLINNAAREGAREAIFGSPENDIETRVRDAASSLDQSDITVTVTCAAPDGTPCPGVSYDDEWAPGDSVIVTVDYEYHYITPITSLLGLGSTQDLTADVEMRIEG